MGLCFLLCRWQVFVPWGWVLVYWAPASVCQKWCSWLVIVLHLCQFLSLSICHWCPPIRLEGQFFFLWDAKAFVHWGRVSWSNRVCVVMLISVDLMCLAISGGLSTFPFQAGSWNVTSFLSEVASCIPEATIIWFFAFSPTGISYVDAAYIWLYECSGVGASCYVLNIFVSTFHHQGNLSSLVKIQFFFPSINVCGYGCLRYLQPASPLTYPW